MAHQRKIKHLLILTVIITLAAILWIFIGNRMTPNKPKKLIENITRNATMFIENIQHTALRDGIKDWTLTAESATLIETEKKALIETEKKVLIKKPKVEFYTKEKENVHLTAQEGIVKTDTNNLEIFGNVVIQNTLYMLKTEKLHYQHKTRIIYSKTPVAISGELFNFRANTMTFDLNTNKSKLIGDVKGTISGTLDF